MTDDIPVCAQCGIAIAGESPSGDPAQRRPCPRCGSTTRAFSAHLQEGATASGTFQAAVITYPQALLRVAQNLIDGAQFSVAVVVSHIACEVATERSLSQSFARRGVRDLEQPVTDLLNGYSLNNERLRNLYSALTGDDIQKQAFWQKFKESATRRNQIVHKGAIVGKQEAEESLKAASALIAYLKQ